MSLFNLSPYPFDRLLQVLFLPLIPRRVTPNQITVLRFLLTPAVGLLVWRGQLFWGTVLFALAVFTDAVDGALARTRGQITSWGALYDPLADKLLIGLTALVILPRFFHPLLVGTIVALELLLIASAYFLRRRRGAEVSSNFWGKSKMVCQSVGVGAVLITAAGGPALLVLAAWCLYAAIVLAIISLITYGI